VDAYVGVVNRLASAPAGRVGCGDHACGPPGCGGGHGCCDRGGTGPVTRGATRPRSTTTAATRVRGS